MAKSKRPSSAYKNVLLAQLSREHSEALDRHFEPVVLETKQHIYEPGKRIEHAYFPEAGMISIVSTMEDGRSIEVGTVGKEGMTGAVLLLGSDSVPYQYYVQIAGHGHRISAALLMEEVNRVDQLRALILQYQAAFLTQTMQAAACNGLHSVLQRCCRWILMSHDRVESKTIPLTHEFLGLMLGVRRASISEVLRPLQERGLIKSGQGEITVLDRNGLEAGSCECYGLIRNQYQQLIG